MENSSKAGCLSSVLINGVITAVVSAAVTVVMTFVLRVAFPETQRVSILPENELAHLPSLRSDVAPLVFKIEDKGTGAYTKPTLFGHSTTSAWYFELDVANLTKQQVDHVIVTLHRPTGLRKILVTSYGGLDTPTGEVLAPGELFDTDKPEVRITLKPLDSGTRERVQILCTGSSRPAPEDFRVEVRCPEGSFKHLTPSQFEDIGWKQPKHED